MLKKYVFAIFTLSVAILYVFAANNFSGSILNYSLFTLTFNVLLYLGFTKHRYFIDLYIGLFLWLGFWLKFTLKILFSNSQFIGSFVGRFDYTAPSFDRALLVSSCGAAGLLLTSLARQWYFSKREKKPQIRHPNLVSIYQDNRKIILSILLLISLSLSAANVYFGIYQRGTIPETTFPFSGIINWLLLFGIASFFTVAIDIELATNKNSQSTTLLTIIDSFFTNVSMFSRGMILNMVAIFIGIFATTKAKKINLNLKYKTLVPLAFIVLFFASVITVNYIRSFKFGEKIGTTPSSRSQHVTSHTLSLIADRWVGIEGVMAVSSYPEKGWPLWIQAWKETNTRSGTSLYDKEIANDSLYNKANLDKHHFISLPGVIAFFYYPGSLLFLFCAMLCVSGIISLIEYSVFKYSNNNLVFCSLIAMVIASRVAHFGYAPKQTYLLLAAIFVNTFIVYFIENVAPLFVKKMSPT